ncbi:hypothetical protein PIB30_112884, partial [Stylosanthes scabra]|nr:hypothetical protein [Stylosanthes scabra]
RMAEAVTDGSLTRTRHGMRVADPGASELYLRWWFLAGKRFLCGDAAHGDVRMTQVPGEASQRVPTAHEPLLRVDDVPDNRLPERRMRVGTRTTARDWQWVNQAMEEDGEVEVAPQRVRRLPEAAIGRRRRGGRGGQGRGGGETRQPEDRMCHTPPGLAHRSSSSVPRAHTMPTWLDVYRGHLR